MKGALLVGINEYPGNLALHGCVNDAVALSKMLSSNGNGSRNFHCDIKKNVASRTELRVLIKKLFESDLDTALFYFSGHGALTERGGMIITPDFRPMDEGIGMDELLDAANRSKIKQKIIILDCCHAGALGIPNVAGNGHALLADGVTIFAAAGKTQSAMERNGHGLFTSLLLSALEGAAADIAGNITAGSIYAYIDRSLGFLEQRPHFKTNISRFQSLRNVVPRVEIQVLKNITDYFDLPDALFQLDKTYEFTNRKVAVPAHVEILGHLQQMRSVDLVEPVGEEHLYWAAQRNKSCRLTTLGKHYWKLIKEDKL
ncbi:caspase domain-containing protein [Mucilaginibacter rubeus]|uniref:Caspase family protein n=1 Tax=Mucilaginibacter rubeus TaxID=2027860 RepID=A0A5C1HU12_9SPHI|nr:caspase family protein [Mucilaginibacter rubeus]QEM09039.1 caspase family protein [Mucilaginibacter rubeus]